MKLGREFSTIRKVFGNMLKIVSNVVNISKKEESSLESQIINEFQDWLSSKIELYDRLAETSNFQIDIEIYNSNAFLLRLVKDELKSLIKQNMKGIKQ